MFIDIAADRFDAEVEFWTNALGYTLSPPRGEHLEFATLLPPDGNPYLRLQRTSDGTNGIHLDLHVASPQDASVEALGLGADLVADLGHVVMRSPAGLTFCFVHDHGEATVPSPVGNPPSRADQVCVDIAPDAYEAECEFWAGLTNWELSHSRLDEFRLLERPHDQPLRFLLQRLDDPLEPHQPHAHLDIACGDHIADILAAHTALGATLLGPTKVWVQMRDPAGLSYCLTPRSARSQPPQQ